MSQKPKLLYFNGKGRAEIIRYVLVAADVDYEDERFEKDDWPKHKDGTPFGQAPTMTIEGHVYCQSIAISRYFARKHGLAGKTPLEELKVDMIIDCVMDVFQAIVTVMHTENETAKAELKTKFIKEKLPAYVAHFLKFLAENKDNHEGFLVGKSLTWADLALFNLKDALEILQASDELNHYPEFNAYIQRIGSLPKIAAWIAKRPVSAF